MSLDHWPQPADFPARVGLGWFPTHEQGRRVVDREVGVGLFVPAYFDLGSDAASRHVTTYVEAFFSIDTNQFDCLSFNLDTGDVDQSEIVFGAAGWVVGRVDAETRGFDRLLVWRQRGSAPTSHRVEALLYGLAGDPHPAGLKGYAPRLWQDSDEVWHILDLGPSFDVAVGTGAIRQSPRSSPMDPEVWKGQPWVSLHRDPIFAGLSPDVRLEVPAGTYDCVQLGLARQGMLYDGDLTVEVAGSTGTVAEHDLADAVRRLRTVTVPLDVPVTLTEGWVDVALSTSARDGRGWEIGRLHARRPWDTADGEQVTPSGVIVRHGDDPDVPRAHPRPGLVWWGTVEPANALKGDVWADPVADLRYLMQSDGSWISADLNERWPLVVGAQQVRLATAADPVSGVVADPHPDGIVVSWQESTDSDFDAYIVSRGGIPIFTINDQSTLEIVDLEAVGTETYTVQVRRTNGTLSVADDSDTATFDGGARLASNATGQTLPIHLLDGLRIDLPADEQPRRLYGRNLRVVDRGLEDYGDEIVFEVLSDEGRSRSLLDALKDIVRDPDQPHLCLTDGLGNRWWGHVSLGRSRFLAAATVAVTPATFIETHRWPVQVDVDG